MCICFLASDATDNSDMAGSSPNVTKKTHLITIRFLSRFLGGRHASPSRALICFPCRKSCSRIPRGLTVHAHRTVATIAARSMAGHLTK